MHFLIDPLRLCIALIPLALYLLVLGWINLGHRPRVISAARDLAALAIGVSGLMIVGPLELFLPSPAAARFGSLVWGLVVTLYVLVAVLMALGQRPRLTIYNISPGHFRTLFEELIKRLDPHFRSLGDTLQLPALEIELRVQGDESLRNVALVAQGQQQSLAGWRRLERALSAELAEVEVPSNPRGLPLVILALAMLATVVLELYTQPDAIAEAVVDMLRLR